MNNIEEQEQKNEPKNEKLHRYMAAFLDETMCYHYKGETFLYLRDHYEVIDDLPVRVVNWLHGKGLTPAPDFVNALVLNIKGRALLKREMFGEMPFWVKGEGKRELTAFKNGLLDVNAFLNEGSTDLIPHSRLWFSNWCLDFAFNPNAGCSLWLNFLHQVFENDADRVALLQEYAGYLLTSDISLQRFLLMVGLPRSGKSTIMRILARLVGQRNVIGYSLERLIGRFDNYTLQFKTLALIPEVEFSDARTKAKICEVLKRIVGCDPVTVECKGKPTCENVTLPTRFVVASNVMPTFQDHTGSLSARTLLLNFNVSFEGREDPALSDKLANEVDGIALWALLGLKRLREKGWTQPALSKEKLGEVRRNNSYVLSFLQDNCIIETRLVCPGLHDIQHVEKSCVVYKDELRQRFKEWCYYFERETSFDVFCKDLASTIPNLKLNKRKRVGAKQPYIVEGLKLTEENLWSMTGK